MDQSLIKTEIYDTVLFHRFLRCFCIRFLPVLYGNPRKDLPCLGDRVCKALTGIEKYQKLLAQPRYELYVLVFSDDPHCGIKRCAARKIHDDRRALIRAFLREDLLIFHFHSLFCHILCKCKIHKGRRRARDHLTA